MSLGLGALLAFKGLRKMIDRSLGDDGRRKGFWQANGGLVLIAASVFVFVRFVGG